MEEFTEFPEELMEEMPQDDACPFCAVAAGELLIPFLYEDKSVFVVRDLKPRAPVHLLIIPWKHIGLLTKESEEELGTMSNMLSVAAQIAKEAGVDKTGYRLVINQGPHSRQEIQHLHVHLLAGRELAHKLG
jgi:histidine triad (HIT) family protein